MRPGGSALGGGLACIGVEGRFVEKWVPASADEPTSSTTTAFIPSAVSALRFAFKRSQVEALAEAVHRGFLILIDYGYTREEHLR
jgi:hypothetical protein